MDHTLNVREHNERLDTLEALVDRIGLADVVDLLAEVASAKADHIRENWQDEVTARTWDLDAARLLNTAAGLRE